MTSIKVLDGVIRGAYKSVTGKTAFISLSSDLPLVIASVCLHLIYARLSDSLSEYSTTLKLIQLVVSSK